MPGIRGKFTKCSCDNSSSYWQVLQLLMKLRNKHCKLSLISMIIGKTDFQVNSRNIVWRWNLTNVLNMSDRRQ